MNPQDLYNTPQVPGIYLFKNKINGKCYVGQAKQSLRRRLLRHKNNLEHDRYDAPFYKALKKYGWENFDYFILEQFDEEYTVELGKKLDELEIHYISVYNSYGKTGYNQTKGGDGGITGYKYTDKQRKHVSEMAKLSAKKKAEEEDKRIYVYNVETEELKMFRMWIDVYRYIGCDKRMSHNNLLIYGKYLFGLSKEEIENKKALYKEKYIDNDGANYGRFKLQMTEEMKQDILNGIRQKDYCAKYGVCRATFLNHRNLLIPDYKREYKQKINDDEFAEYYIQHPSVSECVEHFNSSERYIYKKIERVRKLGLIPANIRKENNNGGYEANTFKTHQSTDKQENPHIDHDHIYNKCVENGYIIIPTETNKETSVSSSQTVSDEPTGLNPSLSHSTPKFIQNTLF